MHTCASFLSTNTSLCPTSDLSSLNVSTKNLALVGAVLLLLDFAATSVVSAATAVTYLTGEVSLPFPTFAGSILVLVIFTTISLSGVKESTRFSLAVLTFHVSGLRHCGSFLSWNRKQLLTILTLVIASLVQWSRVGNAQIRENWNAGQASSARVVARQIFNGFCIGMLGLTGFECGSPP
jgi:hypothetical protein